MKISCNCAGSIEVHFVADGAIAYQFDVVPGDIIDVLVPDDCFILFSPVFIFGK